MSKLAAEQTLLYFASLLLVAITMANTQGVSFDTNFVEHDTSKMIHTSDFNYAICDQNFPSNWRSVSVNGDDVTIATKDNHFLVKKYSALTRDEKNNLESIKGTLTSVIRLGPFNVKSQTGLCKLTTFDRNGGTSTMGTGGSSSSSSSSSASSGGMSIQRTGKSSYIVSKSDFQFNWNRVFVNEDVVTIVYRDGRVVMLPQVLFKPDERAKLVELRQEVDRSGQAAEHMISSVSNSFKNPMDFVSKAMSSFFG